MSYWVVGVDLGASKVAMSLVNPADGLAASRRFPTNAHLGPEQAAANIVQAVRDMEAETGARAKAIGIGSPGPVDHANGMIVAPPNMPTWRDVPFRQMIAGATGVPVSIEHDAKAAALGELHAGAGKARGARDLAYVIVGTGVGAAIIIDGQLFRGRHDSAGEIGHVTIDRNGLPGSSGVLGCVESFTSGPYLAVQYERRGGVAPANVTLNGESIVRLAAHGDAIANAVLDDAGDALAAGVSIIAMLMDIDLYVIGGSVAKAGERLLAPARAALPKYCYTHVAKRIEIVETPLHESGAILGCAWQARELIAKHK